MSPAAAWRVLPPLLLLGAFALLAVTSMARLSITGDEVSHLPAGYSYVTTGDFRLNPQHPPLIKALAGLPLLALDLRPAAEVRGWKHAREWAFGRNFLVRNRQPLERIVFWGRVPMVMVGVLLGAGLFVWARRLWGYWPALFVLYLYVLCPNLLAHAPIVHTDVGVTCFTVLTLYALWGWAASGRLRDAAACGVALGLTLLSKYSGLVTAALVATLFGATVVTRRARFVARGRAVASAALAIGLIPVLMIAVGFGFPHGLENYAHGVSLIHADANPQWQAFLWGEYSATGFWDYYLLAQLWKTPLPTLLCFAGALLLIGRDRRVTALDWAFVLLPIAAFHAAGMWQRASIGVRHVLPAFPFIMLACGATARWVAEHGVRARAALAVLCLWLAVGTLRMWPHFLPYFNELAGGPARGAYYLDDSNVEWGQALNAVGEYLATHPEPPARLLAFTPLAPRRFGIHAGRLTLRDVVWPQPGVTYLVGASTLRRGLLFKDLPSVRFDWLERYRPLEQVGWSIDVFRFSTDPSDRDRADVIYVPRELWYANAIDALVPLLARAPEFASARETLAAVHADRARWAESRGDVDGALRDYFAAAATAPQTPQYKADFRDAVLRLGDRVTLGDATIDDDFQAASVACRADTGADCLLALLRCVRKSPQQLRACLNLGSVYAAAGYPGLAEREWERCLRVDPAFTPARDNLIRLRAP